MRTDVGSLRKVGHNVPVITEASAELFERARSVTPGGVNSPVRAFNAVGGTPRFIRSAAGAWLTDVDGNDYVDLICSWGPMLLGHAHPEVQAAVQAAVAQGTSYGTPTQPEVELAEEIVARTPVDKVRFVSSGTEATMSALRLARTKIAILDPNVPVTFGDTWIHYSEFDSLIESPPAPAPSPQAQPETAPWDDAIAGYVGSLIRDRDTIQVGVGSTTSALVRLGALSDKRDLSYFAGLTEPEIAAALGITDRTVRRDWERARLLLMEMLGR